ncbi:Integrase catalytic region, partial [Leptonema illini DSM 21528]
LCSRVFKSDSLCTANCMIPSGIWGEDHRFETMQAAIDWMERFQEYYNHSHRHSAIGYVTPAQRRTGESEAILAKRRLTYAVARAKHPERWSRHTRPWTQPEKVALNPRDKQKTGQDAA